MTIRSIHILPAAGGGGGSGTYTPPITYYVQTFSVPNTTWTVTHPLGTQTPLVQLWDLSGTAITEADITAPDTSTVIVNFALPVAGRVVLAS